MYDRSSNETVGEIARKKFPHVLPEDKVTRIREIMRETGWRIVPVINREDEMKLIGVVYRLDILNVSSGRSDLLARDVMNEPPLVLSIEDIPSQAVARMIECDEWYVPVVGENMRIIGIFGLEDFIRHALEKGATEKLEIRVIEGCTREVEYLDVEDEISRAWYLMLKRKYAGFPVVKDKMRLVGVLTQHDLLKKGYARVELESESRPRRVKVKEVMTTPAISVPEEATLLDAAKIIVGHDIGRVYIVDDKKRLTGVVDREDVAKKLIGR